MRRRRAAAAHEAVRGRKVSVHERKLGAISREQNASRHIKSSHERTLIRLLQDRGVAVTPQKAVHVYNVDIALTEFPVAVEVFGGDWHSYGTHAARFTERLEYLLNSGWHVIIVWTVQKGIRMKAPAGISAGAADYIIRLAQKLGRTKPVRGHYHVIWGDGYTRTRRGDNIKDYAFIEGSCKCFDRIRPNTS